MSFLVNDDPRTSELLKRFLTTPTWGWREAMTAAIPPEDRDPGLTAIRQQLAGEAVAEG